MKNIKKIAGYAALSLTSSIALANSDIYGLTNYKVDPSKYDEYSNSYKANPALPKITAYLSNWTHYQQGYQPNIEELSKYDTVLLSFFGLCGTEVGDPTVTSGVNALKRECAAHGLKKYELSTTDSYADLEKAFQGGAWRNTEWLMENPRGLLGVMKTLHEQKGTRIGISVFGWSLSNIASQAMRPENRQIFLDSLLEFVKVYPFIGQLDIDWEYPGIKGADNNVFDPANDARNYKEFIAELRKGLDDLGRSDVIIGIASGAPHDKIDAAKLNDLVEAGVDNIHLMTYDFFGQWDDTLNHHTNLYSSNPDKWSADKAITYMIEELGVPSQNIQIGYANYSRNAIATSEVQPSPLQGDFRAAGNTIGTFEAAVTSINDIFANYVNVSQTQKLTGKNGFNLYTDVKSNADFLYNPDSKLFLSIDTPRTVYAKAQYAIEKNLGGIFNWMADHDEGLMLNAAREGLGYEVQTQRFDMHEIINSCGINITSTEQCYDLTHLEGGLSILTPDQEDVWAADKSYPLSITLEGFSKSEVQKLKWTVKSASGIDKANVSILKDSKADLEQEMMLNVSQEPNSNITVNLGAEMTLLNGEVYTSEKVYTVKVGESVPVVSEVKANKKKYTIGSEDKLQLTAVATDSKDDALAYQWTLNDESVLFATNAKGDKITIDTSSLRNSPEYKLKATVTVINKFGNTAEGSKKVKIIGNEKLDQAPVASFILSSENLESGDVLKVTSTSSDENLMGLKYRWTIKKDGEEVALENNKLEQISLFVEEGKYVIKLKVTDEWGNVDNTKQTVMVSERTQPVEPEEGNGNGEDNNGGNSGDSNAWNASTIYTSGDMVSYNGKMWMAQWWIQGGNDPETTYNNDKWGVWRPAQ